MSTTRPADGQSASATTWRGAQLGYQLIQRDQSLLYGVGQQRCDVYHHEAD